LYSKKYFRKWFGNYLFNLNNMNYPSIFSFRWCHKWILDKIGSRSILSNGLFCKKSKWSKIKWRSLKKIIKVAKERQPTRPFYFCCQKQLQCKKSKIYILSVLALVFVLPLDVFCLSSASYESNWIFFCTCQINIWISKIRV